VTLEWVYRGTRLKLHIKILDFNSKLVSLLGMSDPTAICQRIDSPSVSALNKKLILSSPSGFLSIHYPHPQPPWNLTPQGMSQPNKQRNQLQGNLLSRFYHGNSLLHLLTGINIVILRFEVFTAVTMKKGIFWDVTPCSSCKNRRSRWTTLA
jgi:hypothetical protein